MKIAILLSGRIKSYDNFLNILRKKEKNIDVFISVNDIYSDFYKKVIEDFGDYLKGFYCKEYNVPLNFKNIWYDKIDDYFNPNLTQFGKNSAAYRTLSCFYNDTCCFKMATNYADYHNFEYNIYLRFRSDIIVDDFPYFDISKVNQNILFSVIPFCKFTMPITDNPNGEYKYYDEWKGDRYHYYGDTKHNGKYVTGDIAYGNRNTMSLYCCCYDYILKKNIENNGNYFICFECSLTTFLEDSEITWEFFEYDYKYVVNRF